MKHFVDIEHLREADTIIGEAVRPKNDSAFHLGDKVVIQHKIDGSNGSFRWEDGELKAYSRKKELTKDNNNRGFYQFVKALPDYIVRFAKDHSNMIFFGEWEQKHTIVYNSDVYNKFYMYDIYDVNGEYYLNQTRVEIIAGMFHSLTDGIEYIATYYTGPFKGWNHAKQYLHKNTYGDKQEGIIIKNQDHLLKNEVESSSAPSYIKIVNAEFKEIQIKNRIKKIVDPNKDIERQHAMDVMEQIVTEARVRKELNKAIDEGLLPTTLLSQTMKDIVKIIPNRVYEDCIKEESLVVKEAGDYAKKACCKITTDLLRKIVLG